jgi:anti-anti-sigma factor
MLDVDTRSDATVIFVTADLDIASGDQLESAITAAQTSEKPIVVSLAECPFCDSTGLGIFMRTKNRLGGSFAVVVPRDSRCHRIFEVTKLDAILPVYPTVDAALDSFQKVG